MSVAEQNKYESLERGQKAALLSPSSRTTRSSSKSLSGPQQCDPPCSHSSNRTSSSESSSSQPPSKEDELAELLALETAGRYIGPMPVEDFLSDFLPQGPSSCPIVAPDVFNTVARASPEIAMYSQFIESISQFAPGMEFVDTHEHACNVDDVSLKPDVSVYAEGSRPANLTTDFATMETWLEFRTNIKGDPFVDHDKDNLLERSAECDTQHAGFVFENDTVLGQQVRGQLTAYALAHLGSQFRNFAFSVLIMGKYARLLRWERGGAVVTRRFDYSENPRILVEFFWRFANLSPQQRGVDTSVNPASSLSSSDEKCIREGLRLKPETSLFEYQVPDGEGRRSYFGPRLPCPSLSLINRSTRALPVYDLENEKCVYLKDTWRIDANDIKAEGEVYEQLRKANVPHIAPFECGGDVGYRTVSHTLVMKDWSCARKSITRHIHYRMVLGIVGRELSSFRSTKELVRGVLDALIAHWQAYDVAKILHRDISSGNIILTADGRGLLIDWELSTSLEELEQNPPDQIGTWRFMSAALLQDPDKGHDLQDDLESFLHVLAWNTIRYVPNKLTPVYRDYYLSIFDENRYSNGKTVGGSTKALFLANYYFEDYKLEHSSPLLALLRVFSDVFVARYGNEPSKVDRELHDFLPQFPDEEKRLYQHYMINKHEQRLKRLKTPLWFITTFEQLLDSAVWPDNDGSILNPVSSPEDILPCKQQQANTDRIQNGDHTQKASYHPSQSVHLGKRARSPSLGADDARGKRPRGNMSNS